MAWVKKSYMNGQHSYWENDKTGEISYQEQSTAPDATGWQEKTYMDGQNKYWENADTGEIVYSKDATLTQEQLQQQFLDVFQNPNSSPWDKAQAVEKHYGIETLAQLSNQGYFGDYAAELNPYIAARQREANDAGFTIGGNKLGLWPVTLGMAAGGLYSSLAGGTTSAAAAPTATGVGSSTATQVGMVGATDAAIGGLGSVPGSTSAFDQLAQGGNTMTDVPLVGDGGGSLANYEAAVDAQYGTPLLGQSAGGGTIVGTGVPASGGAAGIGGSVAGGAGAAVGGTALSRILDGTATAADYLSMAGNLGGAALGYLGADQQADAYSALAQQYMNIGAPSRARYEASYAPGFSMNLDPGYKDALDQTTKSFLHKASVTGNPVDSPNAWMQTLKDVNSTFAYPALQDFRRMNANAGGLSRFADAAPGAASGAINADAGKLNAIGYGVGNIFNPPTTLEQLLKGMR
jgi:hypothetical protein